MAVHCPKCGKEYDVVRFEGEKPLKCQCGLWLDIHLFETPEDLERFFESEEERKKAKEIQDGALQICRMILDEHIADVDIEIAKSHLRQKAEELFPDKIELYEMIYEARFRRLSEQFRSRE